MPLSDVLNNYKGSITEANGFISLAFQTDAGGSYLLPPNQRDFITDSAFLKIFIAWETFLEAAFLQYLLGEQSISGITIIRHAFPVDLHHANKILIGTQKYVDWANPEIVIRLSKLYFVSGNPIDTYLSSTITNLFDLKTVRNAAAHLTSTTGTQLDSLASRRLGSTQTGIKVSDFIFSVDPNSSTSDNILTTYLTDLDICAEGIANG